MAEAMRVRRAWRRCMAVGVRVVRGFSTRGRTGASGDSRRPAAGWHGRSTGRRQPPATIGAALSGRRPAARSRRCGSARPRSRRRPGSWQATGSGSGNRAPAARHRRTSRAAAGPALRSAATALRERIGSSAAPRSSVARGARGRWGDPRHAGHRLLALLRAAQRPGTNPPGRRGAPHDAVERRQVGRPARHRPALHVAQRCGPRRCGPRQLARNSPCDKTKPPPIAASKPIRRRPGRRGGCRSASPASPPGSEELAEQQRSGCGQAPAAPC